jgi:hypothetical protein
MVSIWTWASDNVAVPATNSSNTGGLVKSTLAFVLLLGLLAVPASSQEWQPAISGPEPTALTYAAEAAGGLALGIGGYVVGAECGGRLFHPDNFVQVLMGLPTAMIGVVGGTCLAGAAFGQDGKLLPTLAYTAGGMTAGTGVCAIGLLMAMNKAPGEERATGTVLMILGAATVVASPGYATWGYNQSRPNAWASSRIVPGSVALGCDTDSNGLCHLSFDARLVSVRF